MLNRLRRMDRDELLIAVYGEEASPDHHPRLSVMLSKPRRIVGSELLAGRLEIELVLSPDAIVDVEAAFAALHRAQSHVANGEWADAWGPAGVAYHVGQLAPPGSRPGRLRRLAPILMVRLGNRALHGAAAASRAKGESDLTAWPVIREARTSQDESA